MISRQAFTLIELLIVVAIIAILAAIAVPNFLEAQTRAKVSRSKADMRSLATAIEAYRIDFNAYPIASQWVSSSPDRPIPDNFNNRMLGLTTPISYITSLPLDVFAAQEGNMYPFDENPTFEYTDLITAVRDEQNPPIIWYGLFEDRESWYDYFAAGRSTIVWILLSPGPDRRNDFKQLGDEGKLPIDQGDNPLELGSQQLYDPTNGTVSRGDVTRTSAEQR